MNMIFLNNSQIIFNNFVSYLVILCTLFCRFYPSIRFYFCYLKIQKKNDKNAITYVNRTKRIVINLLRDVPL